MRRSRQAQTRWASAKLCLRFSVIAAGGSLMSVAGAAPLKSVDPLAESALTAATRTSDAGGKNSHIAAARLQIQTRAAQFPNELAKAKVVLGRGYSSNELQQLAGAGALELLQVEAKIPVPGSDEVYTVILAGAALEGADGSISARLNAAQSSTQAEFRKLAAADATSRTKYSALSRSPLLFYAFESIGKNAAIAALGNSADVSIVQLMQTEDATRERDDQRAVRQSMRELRSISTGSRLKALPVEYCELNVRSAESPVANATPYCPQEPTEPPEPPSTPLPVPTGVPFVDSALSGSNQFIDSYKDTVGGPGKILMPGELFMDCDSSVPGSLCPSDYTYTTRGITGGTLAWGAAIQQAGGPQGGVVCGIVYHWPTSGDTVGYYGWDCWWGVVNTPKWTYAAAVAKFSFGAMSVYIPLWVDAAETARYNVPTFAWSGARQQVGGGPAECIPNGSPFDVSRPCQSYARNGNFVVGQSGFEDKVIIPNPSCHTLVGRTGGAGDKNNQCFSPDRVITNLPAAYLDTTFQDADIDFIASVGVADGKLLMPGRLYESRVDGSMRGWENIRGLTARHLQAVTVRDNAGAPCITGVGGAPAGGGAACMFNVDIVRVGQDGVFR